MFLASERYSVARDDVPHWRSKEMQADLSPAGNTYSIRNVGSGTARVFFAQAREMNVEDEE
jgi:hypothetical protein